MRIIENVPELRAYVEDARRSGKDIGFVPTMGFLHEGHCSLMRRARRENDVVICSVFVNPIQFGPNEDYEAYPRNSERDSALMVQEGVDVAFMPSVDTLYPEGFHTAVEVTGSLTRGLCGASRPGHFKGVTTIVAKLFNLVQPHRAYFGQKDAQQVAVIRRMVRDLNMPVEIVPCPIVRESDGLALSSRNAYLSPEERKNALGLSRSLFELESSVRGGETEVSKLKSTLIHTLQAIPGSSVDYAEIVSEETLLPCERVDGKTLVALAVKIGKTRLIDNIVLEVPCAR